MIKRHIFFIIALLFVATTSSARMFFGGNIGSGGGGVTCPANVLCPLSGGSLATANSGTITFDKAHTWQGYKTLSNGSDFQVPAMSVCNAKVVSGTLQCVSGTSGTSLYLKYNTNFPSPWPTTACLSDKITVVTTLAGGVGGPVTNHDGTWTWGANNGDGTFKLNLNGSYLVNASQLTIESDDAMYIKSYGLFAQVWFVYYTPSANFVGIGQVSPDGYGSQATKVMQCPSGL